VSRARILVPLAALLLSACSAFDTAAATVNGRKIDEGRFVRQLDFVLADPGFAEQFPGAQGVEQRKVEARNLLTFLIHQELVQAYAEENDLGATTGEVQAQIDALIAQVGGREIYEQQLRQSGATAGDVEELIRQQILRGKVADAVVEEEVTDDQLQQIYQERLAEFTQVRVSHILVRSQDQARKILEDATPKTFARLARRFSEDPGSAPQGGDLGLQRPADLVDPFGQTTLEIPVGEIGFHIIYVEDRQTQPFEDVQGDLLEEIRGQVFTTWLLGRVEGAEIRVNPRYGYFDEASGQVLERTSTSPEPPVQVAP
jgi:parvulin-like peptidyl-prolyl isomerase